VKLGQVANSKPSGVADLIREFDGHSTSLGSMPDWPQSLRTAADMMLASGHATCIAWGKERIFSTTIPMPQFWERGTLRL
jgi:hypothetical protein